MTIKDFGYGALSIVEINNEFNFGYGGSISMSTFRGKTWANPKTGDQGIFTTSGAISFTDFYGKAKRKFISLTISSNTQNYVIDNSVSGYIAGMTNITLTINGGVTVGSASTGSPALWIKSGFTGGDVINIVNNGIIIGAGGDGGDGANDAQATVAGTDGGPAIKAQWTTIITNNNMIYGGGGGGGGGDGDHSYDGCDSTGRWGGSGGGGAGYNAGTGSVVGAYAGSNGTLLTGGAGGSNYVGGGANTGLGGAGGDAGQPGTAGNGTNDVVGGGTPGGLAGYYIDGISNVTFAVLGTVGGRTN